MHLSILSPTAPLPGVRVDLIKHNDCYSTTVSDDVDRFCMPDSLCGPEVENKPSGHCCTLSMNTRIHSGIVLHQG